MLADDFPTVAVFDLAARPGTGRLVAATHGRGMFEIPIEVPLTARVRPEAVADTILIDVEQQRNGRVIVAPRGRNDHMAGWSAAISGTAPWLTLTTGTGQGRGRFSYAVAAAELAPGDHQAAMEVTVAGVAGAFTIPVSVHVASPRGHMTLARSTTEMTVLVNDTEPFEDSVAVSFEGPQAATVEWRATQPGNSRWIQLKSEFRCRRRIRDMDRGPRQHRRRNVHRLGGGRGNPCDGESHGLRLHAVGGAAAERARAPADRQLRGVRLVGRLGGFPSREVFPASAPIRRPGPH